jgi:hypothetical protein
MGARKHNQSKICESAPFIFNFSQICCQNKTICRNYSLILAKREGVFTKKFNCLYVWGVAFLILPLCSLHFSLYTMYGIRIIRDILLYRTHISWVCRYISKRLHERNLYLYNKFYQTARETNKQITALLRAVTEMQTLNLFEKEAPVKNI